ncbi:MAG: hypothetical protein IT434_08445 [Phycisphaerales bacterium]|nr:hypothetical protein [Phycisphaerales bacterium]
MGMHSTLGFLAVGGALLVSRGAHAQQLANPGFESGPILSEIVEQFGVWSVDGGTAVGPTQGITPLEGSKMLRFQETAPFCQRTDPWAWGELACVGQLIDLAPVRDLIQSGNARLVVSAAFNRIAGDARTDTEFLITVRAFDEPTLDGFRTECLNYRYWDAEGQVSLISDASPLTWERAEVVLDLDLPWQSDSTFGYVFVRAKENVRRNYVYGEEFDGHFADDVRFEVQSRCPADFDLNGFVNADDYDLFAELFDAADPSADFNADGFVNGNDYDEFADHFDVGC